MSFITWTKFKIAWLLSYGLGTSYLTRRSARCGRISRTLLKCWGATTLSLTRCSWDYEEQPQSSSSESKSSTQTYSKWCQLPKSAWDAFSKRSCFSTELTCWTSRRVCFPTALLLTWSISRLSRTVCSRQLTSWWRISHSSSLNSSIGSTTWLLLKTTRWCSESTNISLTAPSASCESLGFTTRRLFRKSTISYATSG